MKTTIKRRLISLLTSSMLLLGAGIAGQAIALETTSANGSSNTANASTVPTTDGDDGGDNSGTGSDSSGEETTYPKWFTDFAADKNAVIVESTKEITNPFPDVVTEAEILAHEEANPDNSAQGTVRKPILRYVVTHSDGTEEINDGVYYTVRAGDTVEVYAVFSSMASQDAYVYSMEPGYYSMSYWTDDAKTKIEPLHDADTSGKASFQVDYEVATFDGQDAKTMTNGSWRFAVMRGQNRHYMYMKATIPADGSQYLYYIKPPILYSSYSQTSLRVGTMFFLRYPVLESEVVFHYVDEADYRKALNLSDDTAITQRSAGQPDFSFTAHAALDIPEIADPVVSKTTTTLSSQTKYYSMATNVRYGEKTDYSSLSAKEMLEYFGTVDSSKVAFTSNNLRPTLSDLTSKTIEDYEYVTNDIDMPTDGSTPTLDNPGNYYVHMGFDENGNYTVSKHYYIIYHSTKPVEPEEPEVPTEPEKPAEPTTPEELTTTTTTTTPNKAIPTLPNTGQSTSLSSIALLGSIVLAVVVIVTKRFARNATAASTYSSAQ